MTETSSPTGSQEAQPRRKWPVWLTVVVILVVLCCCCVALSSAATALWNFGDSWFGLVRHAGALLPA
jgi:hypothetical protein